MIPRSRPWIIETLPLGDSIDLSALHAKRLREEWARTQQRPVKRTWWERMFGCRPSITRNT